MTRRRGEWPFVAGLVAAAGLFGAAHVAGAHGGEVSGTLRDDAGKRIVGTPAAARIDEVKGASAVFDVGTRRYTLAGTSHAPRVGEDWRVAITANYGGKPIHGTVSADALVNGNVVRHVDTGSLRHGVYVVSFHWPAESVGVPLALRFGIDDGSVSESLLYAVKVRPANG